MSRLFSDTRDAGGRRYYYSLATAPGAVHPSAQATLTITGLAPTIQEGVEAFRTPATAVLTLNGQQVGNDIILRPDAAALTLSGQIPGMQTTIIVTNALPPDYTDLPDNAPTILFINTVTPTTGLIQISNLELNVTPGGNIGYITPLLGSITLQGRAANLPFAPGLGALSVAGLVPSLHLTLMISPGVGSIALGELEPSLDLPFHWIDANAPPAITWTTAGISA